MATKNFVRTVTEGRRTWGNPWSRRLSNGLLHANVRRVSGLPVSSAVSDFTIYPARKLVWRRFNDKLGPAERWLASQVGRRSSDYVIDCFGILRKVKRK